jgi:hypothetical protein
VQSFSVGLISCEKGEVVHLFEERRVACLYFVVCGLDDVKI